jgi:poly(glycerol-phosphate) alpha-glucosyltransferase
VKLAVLCTSLSRRNGGVSEAARRLTQEIARHDAASVDVLGIWDEAFPEDEPGWSPLRPKAFPAIGPRGFGYTPEFRRALTTLDPDLCHVHGLWNYPGIAARCWAQHHRRPSVITVHGMLDAWALANSGWKKRLASALFENKNLGAAACLHAITSQEIDAIRKYGVVRPICLIPNGVDLPSDTPVPPPAWLTHARGRKVLLYLGRIHPKKGLLELIEGWSQAIHDQPALSNEWMLVIAGWDQGGFESKLRARVADLSLDRDITFVGPQFGPDKASSYAHASAFILPSFSEGLPLVVLEAWAHHLPVLMTEECCLSIGFDRQAALQIQPTAHSVSQGLLALRALSPTDRAAMGTRGRALVESHFTWSTAAASMRSVYAWLLGHDSKPPCLA